VFYGDKAIDRSPCGTGTSARMAQLAAKGRLKVGDDFVHESIIGSLFDGRVEAAARVGQPRRHRALDLGWARQHGVNTILVDDRDPFAHGFQVAEQPLRNGNYVARRDHRGSARQHARGDGPLLEEFPLRDVGRPIITTFEVVMKA